MKVGEIETNLAKQGGRERHGSEGNCNRVRVSTIISSQLYSSLSSIPEEHLISDLIGKKDKVDVFYLDTL